VPEAQLAREAEMCYAVMAHVTDRDVGHATDEAVTVTAVVTNLLANVQLAKQAIVNLASAVPMEADCACHHALQEAIITQRDAVPERARKELELLVGKYLA